MGIIPLTPSYKLPTITNYDREAGVWKCPNCGAVVMPGSLKQCPMCTLMRKIDEDPDEESEAGVLHWEAPTQRRSGMSWSFQAVGKPEAVARAATAAMETNQCLQPEESYRLGALAYITSAACQLVGVMAVQVTASGSMWKDGDTVKNHTLQLEFTPLYGFVE